MDLTVAPTNAADAYRALSPAVLGYLRACRTGDPEDLLGEVFVRVARDIEGFHGSDSDRRRWVFTIARHTAIDASRSAARRPRIIGGEPPDRPSPPAPEPFDPVLVEALGALTAAQREVVVLRFVADLPINDVARIVRRPQSVVKSLQHRGLARLEQLLSS